jgi:hypothetical protein
MFEPLAGAGKTLVVRDFAYSSGEQSLLVEAARAVSPDVVMALKNVPHDFWPTFPHNPAIGDSAGLRQWVEYDVLGQYCGLGVVPCALLDDVRSRLSYCAEHGVQGVWFRTDWELVNDLSVFNSLNKVNLYAGAALAADPSVSSEEIYGRWLRDGISTAMRPESLPLSPESPCDVEAVRSVMAATWPVLERAMYTRGHVFQYSSKIAPTLDDFFYVAERYHSREQWDPGSSARVQVDEANVRAVVEEKELSRRMVRELRESAKPFSWGLSEELAADIDATLDLLVDYVEMYSAVVVAGFRAALALRTARADHLEQARAAVRSLTAFREHVEAAVPDGRYPYYVYWLFDTQLLRGFEDDLAARLAA